MESLRILIAEDDEAAARLYASYARKRGHEALIARDGPEALAVAAEEIPSVIWLDIGMPRLDGRDVCRQLRADPRTRDIPVLVVTAFANDQYLRDVLVDLGAWDVLEKPVDLSVAFNKLERLAARVRSG